MSSVLAMIPRQFWYFHKIIPIFIMPCFIIPLPLKRTSILRDLKPATPRHVRQLGVLRTPYLSWRERWPWGWRTPPSPPWASCICAPAAGWRRRGRAGPSAASAPRPWCSPPRTPARPRTAASGTRCWGWGSPSRRSEVSSSGLRERGRRSLRGQKNHNFLNILKIKIYIHAFFLICFFICCNCNSLLFNCN